MARSPWPTPRSATRGTSERCLASPGSSISSRTIPASCALREDNTVWCWGEDRAGQLGDGEGVAAAPGTVVQVYWVEDAVQIESARAAGHTCARRQGGEVVCWGVLTSITGGNEHLPVAVGIDDAVDIAARDDCICAVLSAGEVVCRGGPSSWLGGPKGPPKD